jgi:hypothetical protein
LPIIKIQPLFKELKIGKNRRKELKIQLLQIKDAGFKEY